MCRRPLTENGARSGQLPRLAGAGVLVAAMFASGCVTTGPLAWVRNGFKVGPDYCKPPAPVAEGWIQSADPSVQNRQVEDWWQVFQDGTLNSLIDTAYVQNLN